MQYNTAKCYFHLLCCQWCGWLTEHLRRCYVGEIGGLDSDQTSIIFGFILDVHTHIRKSSLLVRVSALLWDRVVLVKGSLHSEVDYDNSWWLQRCKPFSNCSSAHVVLGWFETAAHPSQARSWWQESLANLTLPFHLWVIVTGHETVNKFETWRVQLFSEELPVTAA